MRPHHQSHNDKISNVALRNAFLESVIAAIAPIVAAWVEISPATNMSEFLRILFSKYWPILVFWPLFRLLQAGFNNWKLEGVRQDLARPAAEKSPTARTFGWIFLVCIILLMALPIMRARGLLIERGIESPTAYDIWHLIRVELWPFYLVLFGALLALFLLDRLIEFTRKNIQSN